MSDNWVVQHLLQAVDTWNRTLTEIFGLLSVSPEQFRGGGIWKVIVRINEVMQGTGLALLVLFFVWGLAHEGFETRNLQRPEHLLRLFLRFAFAKGLVTYALPLMQAVFGVMQGMISDVAQQAGVTAGEAAVLPQEMISAVEQASFFQSVPLWSVTLIGALFVTVLSFVMILTVYGRFFRLYFYTALAPVPLAAFASEATQNTAKSFLKSYFAVCLEGVVIMLACVIFSAFVSQAPSFDQDINTVTGIWMYLCALIFNMLVLVGAVKASDRVVREMMGI